MYGTARPLVANLSVAANFLSSHSSFFFFFFFFKAAKSLPDLTAGRRVRRRLRSQEVEY